MLRDGDAPHRDPWAGGVLTLPHHPRVLVRQARANRLAHGVPDPIGTGVLAGALVALWIAAFLVVGGC